MEFIDLKAQYHRYRTEIDGRIRKVLDHGRFIMGPEVKELEEALAGYVGVKHCATAASGTMALEIALRALDIGPGDEVITTPFTWISTAEVIKLVGARPVFVDIEPKTYNIDADRIEAAITPREDGAQSFGATQRGKRSCGVTKIGCTSFFPAKPFGCYGDGGAVFTDDDALAERIRAIRTHGGVRRHEHTLVGTNGRFDTIQAAVLLAKLPHFDWEVSERSRIGARYTDLLKDVCVTPEVAPGNTHVYAQYTVRAPDRDQARAKLQERGIPTAVYYPKCLHQQPAFADLGYGPGSFPEAERASREVFSLPMHPLLPEEDQDMVVAALKEALAG